MNTPSTTQWYMVTNHLNLCYMLTSGLILPSTGFGDKYYRDPLQVFPGYIPLFRDPLPGTAIEMATKEAGHLIPVAAPIDLKGLEGKIAAIDLQGRLTKELDYPEGLTGNEAVLLIPAPLPVTRMMRLNFETQAAIQKFKKQIKEYSNVSIDNLSLKPLKKLFKDNGTGGQTSLLDTPWYSAGTLERKTVLDLPLAAGGLMGLTFHLADKNGSSMSAFDHAFCNVQTSGPDEDRPGFTDRPLSWLVTGQQPPEGRTLTEKLFWSMMREVADQSTLPGGNARDRAMDFLENQCMEWPDVAADQRLKTPLEVLTRDLDGLDRGNCDLTRSQLFERHSKPFSRAVILFFLHRDNPGLIEGNSDLLNLDDILAANLLVCAHRGWLGLSTEMKQGIVLETAVTHTMATLSHTLSDSALSLGPRPEPPVPFFRLFAKADGQWNTNQKKAALFLAKAQKWDHCIATSISLGNGEYQLKSTTGGVTIVLEGLEKGISHDIHEKEFLTALTRNPIPEKQYLEARKLMASPR